MYEENILLLIIALAKDAADEYREYRKILTNKCLWKSEREYYKIRAEETLSFFDSNIFTTAFPGKGEYIKEQLRNEDFRLTEERSNNETI